jgi:hypothetical protein
MMRGDFAPRSTASVATEAAAGPLDIKPAVLVQQGNAPAVTSAAPQRSANLDALPPLPKGGDVAPAPAAPAKTLSADEKARVIAELEALARGDAPTATGATTGAGCTLTPAQKSGTAQTVAATNKGCPAAQPAPRP